MDFRANKVESLDCASCGKSLDPSISGPLSVATCPHCGAEVEVPAQFDHFLLLKQLGNGASGFVFRAFDTHLHRQVAIKVLLSNDDGAELAQECLTEARTLAALNHRSIVHIYGLGEFKGQNYMVMELITGGSLQDFTLPGQEPGEVEAIDIGIALAEGLRAAHRAGLVHMDVKPGNVLRDAEGHPKLIDFGAAQYQLQLKERGFVGTPYYIAPETAQQKTPDFRADIYSLGATLFHILTGRPPFKGGTPKETVELRLHRAAPSILQFRDYLHPETDRVIRRMLQMDPEDRFESYDELIDALKEAREALAPTTTVAAPPPPPEAPPASHSASLATDSAALESLRVAEPLQSRMSAASKPAKKIKKTRSSSAGRTKPTKKVAAPSISVPRTSVSQSLTKPKRSNGLVGAALVAGALVVALLVAAIYLGPTSSEGDSPSGEPRVADAAPRKSIRPTRDATGASTQERANPNTAFPFPGTPPEPAPEDPTDPPPSGSQPSPPPMTEPTPNPPTPLDPEVGPEAPVKTPSQVEPLPLAEKSPLITGYLLHELFDGVSGNNPNQIRMALATHHAKAESSYVRYFQASTGPQENSIHRLRGFIHPPETGNYRFWVAGDGSALLYLSTDSHAKNKREVARCAAAVARGEWLPAGRSAQAYALEKGRRYYIEAVQGGPARPRKFMTVGWEFEDGTLERPISGIRLSPAVPAGHRAPSEDMVRFVGLTPTSAISSGGIPLNISGADGGTVVAAARAMSEETYTIKFQTNLTGITAFRLEALRDSTLPSGGPGFGRRGRFEIHEMQLTTAPIDSPEDAHGVVFGDCYSDLNLDGSPVERAVDQDTDTLWSVRAADSVDEGQSEPFRATFLTKEPIGYEGGTILTVKLPFAAGSNLGKFRVAATTMTDVPKIAADSASREASKPKKFEMFINLGGEKEMEGPQGNIWVPAVPFHKGGAGYDGGARSVANQAPNQIVGTCWMGIKAFRFSVPKGNYRVGLLFADYWIDKPQMRVFSVSIEGNEILPNLDLAHNPGPNKSRPWPPSDIGFAVEDGVLDIEFKASKLQPLINAIRIEPASRGTLILKPK